MRKPTTFVEDEKSGSSRFQVLYSMPRGTKKQRQWRDGALRVGFAATTLFDTEEHRTVTSQRGSGLLPNRVFQAMKAARGGMGWYPRRTDEGVPGAAPSHPLSMSGLPGYHDASPVDLAEVAVGPYQVQIMEVLELHLLPYDSREAPPAGDAGRDEDGEGSNTLRTASCSTPAAAAATAPGPREIAAATEGEARDAGHSRRRFVPVVVDAAQQPSPAPPRAALPPPPPPQPPLVPATDDWGTARWGGDDAGRGGRSAAGTPHQPPGAAAGGGEQSRPMRKRRRQEVVQQLLSSYSEFF